MNNYIWDRVKKYIHSTWYRQDETQLIPHLDAGSTKLSYGYVLLLFFMTYY